MARVASRSTPCVRAGEPADGRTNVSTLAQSAAQSLRPVASGMAGVVGKLRSLLRLGGPRLAGEDLAGNRYYEGARPGGGIARTVKAAVSETDYTPDHLATEWMGRMWPPLQHAGLPGCTHPPPSRHDLRAMPCSCGGAARSATWLKMAAKTIKRPGAPNSCHVFCSALPLRPLSCSHRRRWGVSLDAVQTRRPADNRGAAANRSGSRGRSRTNLSAQDVVVRGTQRFWFACRHAHAD